MVVSIVIDWSRSRALARVAKKYDSQALEADALHFSTDIWSSSVVLVGLFGVLAAEMLFMYLNPDGLPLAALYAVMLAVVLGFNGFFIVLAPFWMAGLAAAMVAKFKIDKHAVREKLGPLKILLG